MVENIILIIKIIKNSEENIINILLVFIQKDNNLLDSCTHRFVFVNVSFLCQVKSFEWK